MKVVLDTNALLVSLPAHSPFRPIWNAIVNGTVELFVTTEIFMEYQEILQQRASPAAAQLVGDILKELDSIHGQEIYYYWDLILADEEDNKFADAAIAGNADYIVTADKHFEVLKTVSFPKVNVIAPSEFLDLLKNESFNQI